jgi:hypothetical protein
MTCPTNFSPESTPSSRNALLIERNGQHISLDEEAFGRPFTEIRDKAQRIWNSVKLHVLSSFYELEILVDQARDLTFQSTVKRSAIELLADELGIDECTLYHCAKLAETVPENVFRNLAKPPLCWDHIRTLINTSQLDRLEYWADRISPENLSAASIEDELRIARRAQRDESGRQPSPPKNFAQGLGQLTKLCKRTFNKLDQALFCDEFDLCEETLNTPPEELTEDFRAIYLDALDRLENVANLARENVQRMRGSMK